MITEQDKTHLRRAMRLAMNGRGHVEPNPMVGCVLVKNGQVIGEGWHKKYGQAHAEPTALNDCRDRGNDPAGATAYVTLEPCCHTNKQTPPCAPRLIEAKIARVVIGCLDPNPDVNGKGVAMLRDAGIEVDCLPGAKPSGPLAPVPGGKGQGEGVRANEHQAASEQHKALTPTLSQGERELDASHFQQLIAPFYKLEVGAYRYITAKWAQTRNGKVAGPDGTRLRITGKESNRLVHRLRSHSDAIVVGVNTVIADDPLLTVRLEGEPDVRQPNRWIFDSKLRTPLTSQLVRTAREVPVNIAYDCCHSGLEQRIAALRNAGVQLHDCDDDVEQWIALHVNAGGDRRAMHILIEPGPTLARAIFERCLGTPDSLWVFQSLSVEAPGGVDAPSIPHHFLPVATLNLAGDVLTEYLNTQSPAFFAPVPSADFVLAQEEVAHRTASGST